MRTTQPGETGRGPARPTSIRLFLADGRPDGLRLVEKSNWTGLALVSSVPITAACATVWSGRAPASTF